MYINTSVCLKLKLKYIRIYI